MRDGWAGGRCKWRRRRNAGVDHGESTKLRDCGEAGMSVDVFEQAELGGGGGKKGECAVAGAFTGNKPH